MKNQSLGYLDTANPLSSAREGAAPRALGPWLNLAPILAGKVPGCFLCLKWNQINVLCIKRHCLMMYMYYYVLS